MLIVSFGTQSERIGDANASAFASCIATLANARIGVRPTALGATERTLRSQLVAADVYAPGVGVAREIVSLPGARVLHVSDVETGLPANRQDGAIATLTLSLDRAIVTSVDSLKVGARTFELTMRQFLSVPEDASVSVEIALCQTSGDSVAPCQVRLAYGLDSSAANEYLGKSPCLIARHYEVAEIKEVQSSNRGGESLSAIVATEELRLRYDIQFETPLSGASLACTNQRLDSVCSMLATLDFSVTNCHRLRVRWQMSVDKETRALALATPAPPLDFTADECRHLARWRALWKDHEVFVDANGAPVELGIRYAVFQLLQHGTGSHDRPEGTISPARGLTSTYHSGATFFDTELHKCIFWIWNDPRVARSLLDYRYRHLNEAIEFSKSTGFSGARFPEASNDQGSENGPHYVLSYPHRAAIREWSVDEVLHISADICYAVYRYWEATADDGFMIARGRTLVLECARFAASAFKWSDSKRAYVIERVMGPDEYHYHVDNSFYTNYMLRWCLEFALSLVERGLIRDARVDEIDRWSSIEKKVYLPWMIFDGTAIPEQFEGYAALPDTATRSRKKSGPQFADENERDQAERLSNFSTKAVKQADVTLLMSMFPHSFADDVKASALRFYEPRTIHESSLSYGPHAVVAADVGATDDCAYFITRASRYNLDFTPVTNYSNGLHLSAYAGAWQGLVHGLAGLRVDGHELHFRPRLPASWRSYRFTIFFRGQRLTVTVPSDGVLELASDGRALVVEREPGRYVFRKGGLA